MVFKKSACAVVWVLFSSSSLLLAEQTQFSLEKVVSPVVAALPEKGVTEVVLGQGILVASPSEKAQVHVQQGFTLIHSQWDFEAYRHFCIALQADPDCLMAYAGVTLALARPYNEYSSYQRAAVDRMLDLIDADDALVKGGKAGRFPLVEKKFAAAVAMLVSSNISSASAAFREMEKDYPDFMQAKLLAIFLARGVYDESGEASPSQKSALKEASSLLEKHPENSEVLSFWISLHAGAPAIICKEEVLPIAQRLVDQNPKMPSWQYALGYYAWRSGDLKLAVRSFKTAADLYAEWMMVNHVSLNDCPALVRAKIYQAFALFNLDEFDEAVKIAEELKELKLDKKRINSDGNAILLWQGKNLLARLYMARGLKGDFEEAKKSLSIKSELLPFISNEKHPSLAAAYIDALAFYVGARKALAEKDTKAAVLLHKEFRKYLVQIAKVSKGALKFGDYSHYLQSTKSLVVLDLELAGLVALADDSKIVAVGHFLGAKSRQPPFSMSMPLLNFYSMNKRLGDLYLSLGKKEEAKAAYQDGLSRFPSNEKLLEALRYCE